MYLTVREVAERLRVNPSTVYQLVERGKLAHHRVGARRGAIRVSESDLTAYLESCHKTAAEQQRGRAPVSRVKLKHIRL